MHGDDSQRNDTMDVYRKPELIELGTLERLEAGSWPGYPDGWRGYYDRD